MLFVRKRNIRYVHIPKGFSAVELFKTLISCPEKKKDGPRTFKAKRAHQYQKETVASLQYK